MRIAKSLLSVFLLAAFMPALRAQDLSIGIVNASEVVNESSPGRIALARLDAYDSERSQALMTLQAELTELTEAYEAQRRALSESALSEREQELIALNTEFALEQESYRADMEARYQELLDLVFALTGEVLESYRVEHGYSMIVDPFVMQGFALAIDPASDLTPEIIRRVNELWATRQGDEAEPTP